MPLRTRLSNTALARWLAGPAPEADPSPVPPRAALPLRALLVAIAMITLLSDLALLLNYRNHLDHQGRQLQAIAELQSRQLQHWLDEHLRQAERVRSNAQLANRSRRAQAGDGAALAQLLDRASQLHAAYGNAAVLVLDARAELLPGDAGVAAPLSATLRTAARLAIATGLVQHAGLYPADDPALGRNSAWFDVVAPMAEAGRSPTGAIVLRADLQDFLVPNLQSWPVASRSAVTRLVYRAGDLYVSGQDVTELASMVKLKAGRLGHDVAHTCLQFWGGMGFTWENRIARAYRDGRLGSIGGGADEVMLGIIARYMGLLKRPVPADRAPG